MKKLLAVALCLVMVLLLFGCCPELVQPTEPGVTPTDANQTVTPSAHPAPSFDPKAYAKSRKELEKRQNLTVETKISRTMTLEGETFPEESTLTLTYTGLGTRDFQAKATQSVIFCGRYNQVRWLYGDKTACLEPDREMLGTFRQDMKQEDFLECFYPLVLVEPELYETVLCQQKDGQTVVTFSQPKAPEHWLGENVTLHHGVGHITLEGETIVSSSYEASYSLGGGEYTLSVTGAISQRTPSPLDVKLPEESVEVESLEGILLLRRAQELFTHALTKSAIVEESLQNESATNGNDEDVEAGYLWKYRIDRTVDYQFWGQEEDLRCLMYYRAEEDQSGLWADPDWEPQEWEYRQLITDGIWYDIDSRNQVTSDPLTSTGVTMDNLSGLVTQFIPGVRHILSMDMEEEDDCFVLTMEGDFHMLGYLQYTLISFNDPEQWFPGRTPLTIQVKLDKNTGCLLSLETETSEWGMDYDEGALYLTTNSYTAHITFHMPSQTAQTNIENAMERYLGG